MKKIFLLLIIGAVTISFPLTKINAATRDKGSLQSSKGWELYSWKVGKQWYFSVLVGTNRNKSKEEVFADSVTLKGVEELKRKLKEIKAGQSLFWGGCDWSSCERELSFPPKEIINDLQAYCQSLGIELERI